MLLDALAVVGHEAKGAGRIRAAPCGEQTGDLEDGGPGGRVEAALVEDGGVQVIDSVVCELWVGQALQGLGHLGGGPVGAVQLRPVNARGDRPRVRLRACASPFPSVSGALSAHRRPPPWCRPWCRANHFPMVEASSPVVPPDCC